MFFTVFETSLGSQEVDAPRLPVCVWPEDGVVFSHEIYNSEFHQGGEEKNTYQEETC